MDLVKSLSKMFNIMDLENPLSKINIPIKDFPDEILLMIMENLSIHDILQLSWTCKRFYNFRRFIKKTSSKYVKVLKYTNTIYEISKSIPSLWYIDVYEIFVNYNDRYNYYKCCENINKLYNTNTHLINAGRFRGHGDAISGIEIIDNDNIIKRVYLVINGISIESKKINGSWDIKNWFTLEKPLMVIWSSYSTIYLHIYVKECYENCESYTIKFNRMVMTEKYSYNINFNKTQVVDYNKFAIVYKEGIVCPYNYSEGTLFPYFMNVKPREYIDYDYP